MGFFKKLKDVIFGSAEGEITDPHGIYFYVRCTHCGTPVRIRIDRRHDLLEDPEQGGYVLHKEMMDGSCFRLMYATVRFDGALHIIEQEVQGGEFITWEEYNALAHHAT